MLLTYGILTFLSIRLMRKRNRKKGGGDNGGFRNSDNPIIPDLPEGVIWPDEKLEEELLV